MDHAFDIHKPTQVFQRISPNDQDVGLLVELDRAQGLVQTSVAPNTQVIDGRMNKKAKKIWKNFRLSIMRPPHKHLVRRGARSRMHDRADRARTKTTILPPEVCAKLEF